MLEKQRSKRIHTDIRLSICDLYKQDASGIHHLEVPIELTNISEHSVGLISECILPMQCFHACLDLGAVPEFLIKLKVTHCSMLEHARYAYVCEFVELEDSFRTSIRNHMCSRE